MCPASGGISRLEAEANEMGSFVHKKAKKQWLWIAMDATGGSRVCIALNKGRQSRLSDGHFHRPQDAFTSVIPRSMEGVM
jgi:hypothetical protein